MNPIEEYIKARDEQARKNQDDILLEIATQNFTEQIIRTNYVKNFTYKGVPIMQLPTDLMAMQELIWQIKPDYIIETGIAFGGMTKFYSDMLKPFRGSTVISIDIDVRKHAEAVLDELENVHTIRLSSLSDRMPDILSVFFDEKYTTLVSLDSNHTHDHVLQELKLYAPLVSLNSYIVVFDTSVEFMNQNYIPKDRPWGKGNSPWTAVQEFLKGNDEFVADKDIENRIVLTSAPGGWLKRVKEAK